MSQGITVTILAGLLLTGCLTGGCGRQSRDHTWYNANGHPIEEKWKTGADGKKMPDPHPYDRNGKPWVYDSNGELVPPAQPTGSSHRSGGLFLWGGSGYRSTGSGTSYRSGSGSSSSSSSSISRGGFGSTGGSSSGS